MSNNRSITSMLPFKTVFPTFDTLDRIFDNFVSRTNPTLSETLGVDFFEKGAYPKVDIVEYTDKFVLSAALPGVDKTNVNVTVDNGMLTIEGAKTERKNEEGGEFLLKELRYASFKRCFPIDESKVDTENLTAEFKDAILNLTIPKKIKSSVKTAKTIQIK